MIYSDKAKLIYYPIFKTGSRSLRELLQLLFPDMKYHGDTHDRQTPEKMDLFTKVSMVRNPYDRAISMWSHFKTARTHPFQEVKRMEFEEFMEWLVSHPEIKSHQLLMNQRDYLKDLELDFIYRLEDLSDRLPKFNVGKHKADHNETTIQLVESWAGQDVEFYGYI